MNSLNLVIFKVVCTVCEMQPKTVPGSYLTASLDTTVPSSVQLKSC